MNLSKDFRTRSWMGTIPAERHDEAAILEALEPYPYVGQLELGEVKTELNPDGYLHWQLYIEHKNAIRLGTLIKALPGSHWEPRRGSKQQAFDYVTKAETYQGVSVANREIDLYESGQGTRSDLIDMKNQILLMGKTASELIVETSSGWLNASKLREVEKSKRDVRSAWAAKNFRDVEVIYTWGKTGTGKTYGVYEEYGLENVFTVGEWRHPFDNYDGQQVLLLDEFYGSLPFENLLKLLDKYPYQLDARYGKRQAEFTTVVMTSNEPLSHQYLDEQTYHPRKWNALMRRITKVQEKVGYNEYIDETHLYKQTEKGEITNVNTNKEKENATHAGFSTCNILHDSECACGAI